ncbi:MAG: DUF1456 family protein [Bacteroidetes bacterium]|nr:DUF1456 family protein [Bacteroidota bacterium]
MTNNDILRRIRFTFDLSDSTMMETFGLGGLEVTRAEISDWLKKDDDPAFQEIRDKEFATFLNGFIISKRGRKEGEQPLPEKSLNNNIILRKLKIALNLMDDDLIEIMKSVDLRISKHEISAFFRKPTQDKYRVCHDQFLRNFLYGLQLKYKGDLK